MVLTDHASQYLNLKPYADLAHQVSDLQGKIILKNLITAFRYTQKVIFDLVLGVAATSLVHARFLKATAS